MRGVTAQVYENGRRLALGASATSAHWIGETALFALGDGSIRTAAIVGPTFVILLSHDGNRNDSQAQNRYC